MVGDAGLQLLQVPSSFNLQNLCKRTRIVVRSHSRDKDRGARHALGSTAKQAALLRSFIEPDLVVLDDLFLARRISKASAELLQTVVHQRYKQRRSIIVTSNRVVQDWGKYLGDATMATTILDRLMHRAAMLEFEGKSYRLKEAASRIALNTADNS